MSETTTRAHVLSNGNYSVLFTESGAACSAFRGYAVTRWQPDPTTPYHGMVCYIRDRDSGAYWTLCGGERGGIRTYGDYVEQWCVADGIETICRTRVAQEFNAEIHTLAIRNLSGRRRRLDLTAYAELSLNAHAADAAHPAFSKLFVQTAYDEQYDAIVAWRRQRSPTDRTIWVAQRLTATREFETDRARFIGRARSIANPLALNVQERLSGSVGAVLDPAACTRTIIDLEHDAYADIELLLCAADTREELDAILRAEALGASATSHSAHALGLPEAWLAQLSLDLTTQEWLERGVHQSAPPAPERAEYGQFKDDGSEYRIAVGRDMAPTPLPWTNVVANENFGFLISERGAGYTWAANSRENRLTPWSNDAVCDPHGEVLLLRDDETLSTWSPLPGPAPADEPYEVQHGFGYSRFLHASHGLEQDTRVYVPRNDPVKVVRVSIANTTMRDRKVSVFCYAHLVLGGAPADTRGSVATSYENGVIFATNKARGEYSSRVAFAVPICPGAEIYATGSRASFTGRRTHLDGRFGTALDPCAALQIAANIGHGDTLELAFLLGEAEDDALARACIAKYSTIASTDAAFAAVTRYWTDLLGRVHVSTPSPALDIMLNGWLAYQNLVCRMWGRSAFYQSGGAFGFRDQLQDSSALFYLDPAITRNQILLHAAHQFVKGDVLHWWHPPTGKGIRTRFSDDLLWLPYITLFYIDRTGDASILDEGAHFMTAEPLERHQDEIFVYPRESGESGTLYEHCCRAIDRSLTRGTHGLPLMGVGDWNDGMNRVGRQGRGESVWLGFFLSEILREFVLVAVTRGDTPRVQRYSAYLQELHTALNDSGWDGEWYRRAYYDDGAPLGSKQSDECRIDALAQAWAVISGVAPRDRAAQAIEALQEHLISERDGIIRLLTPAFDKTDHDPGYIKGYVPGVRENGGQYTHAALWVVRALAEMGMRDRAAPLLEMLSPVTRSRDAERYKGEPYVIAADVYGEEPHVGRAGWTWYTGSAGWMYRVLLESVLGFDLRGNLVRLRPCVPEDWPRFMLRCRFDDGTTYQFDVETTTEPTSASEGQVVDNALEIVIQRDRAEHVVRVSAGPDIVPGYAERIPPLLATTSA